MSAEIDRPTLFAARATASVFLVILACLLAQLLGSTELVFDLLLYGGVAATFTPLALLVGVLVLLVRARVWPARAHRLRREALLIPCMLAPVAALAPWVIAPSHFGMSLGHLPFFVAWLTRYPSHGPINLEVLLGIGAMLGACAMPAFFALYASTARPPRPSIVAAFALLQLVAYVPVLLRLDLDLAVSALFVLRDGPISIFSSSEAAWWVHAPWALWTVAGALLRALATAAMLASVPLSLRRTESAVWET